SHLLGRTPPDRLPPVRRRPGAAVRRPRVVAARSRGAERGAALRRRGGDRRRALAGHEPRPDLPPAPVGLPAALALPRRGRGVDRGAARPGAALGARGRGLDRLLRFPAGSRAATLARGG